MADEWPAQSRRRKPRPAMTPEQQAMADDIHVRALAIRAASDGEVSIREAVDLAAVQLGLESPQVLISEEAES